MYKQKVVQAGPAEVWVWGWDEQVALRGKTGAKGLRSVNSPGPEV